jgi:xylulokinase
MAFIGIDLGTSGLRALLIDDNGQSIGSTSYNYPLSQPKTGWFEQNPADWITALESAMLELSVKYPNFAYVRGIGVTGHMHGATLLDGAGAVIRPCILWNDTRSAKEALKLDQTDKVRQLSGNIVFSGFTAPKLAWLQKNESNNFKRIAKVLLPAAYLNYYLTGDYVSDMSDSSGTAWLDTGRRQWSDYLLRVSNMRLDQMPRLIEGNAKAGELRLELIKKWGLSAPVYVAGGAGDNAAAACGIGVLREGQSFVSLGTSGVILAARNDYVPAFKTAVHTFCHAIPHHWYQMGVMLSATGSLNWLSLLTGKEPTELTKALGLKLQAPGKIQFIPYLSGERTPHNDAAVRGGFLGLSANTSTEDITHAVLSGVAFGLRDSFEELQVAGVKFDKLIAIGGGTDSHYWCELIATVLGVPLLLPKNGDFGAALGAARLAFCATTGANPVEIMTPPVFAKEITPNIQHKNGYDEEYKRFRKLYPVLKELN